MEQLPSSRYKEKKRLNCVNCARELTDLDTKVDTLSVIDQNRVIRIPVKNVLSQIYSLKFLNVFENEEETVNEEAQVLCFLCSNKLKCCYETYLDFNHARDSVSLLSKKIQRLEDFVVTSTVEVPNPKSNNNNHNHNTSNNGLGCSKLVVDPVNIVTGDSGYVGYSSLEPLDDDDETNSSIENNGRNNSKDLSGSDEDQDSFQNERNISFEVIQSEDEENLPGTSSQVRVIKSTTLPNSVEKSRCSITSSRIFTSNTRLPNLQNQYTPTKHQQSSSSSNTVIRKPQNKHVVYLFECQICNSIFDSIQDLNEHTSEIHSIKSKIPTQQPNTIATTPQIESHGRVLRSSPNKNELLLQQVQISIVNKSRKPKKNLQTYSRKSYTEPECEDSGGGNESDSFLLSPESIQVAVMPARYNTRGRSASNSNSNSNSSSPSKQIISSNKTLPCEIRNLNEVQSRVEERDEELDNDNDQDDEKDKTYSPRQRGRIVSTSTSTSRRSSESGKRRSNRRRIRNPNLEVSRYWTQELLYPPRCREVKVEPIVDIPLPEGKSKPPFACPYCPIEQQQVLVYQNIDDYETHVKETHLGLKRLTSTDSNSEDEEDFLMDDGDDIDNNEDDNTHQNVPNKTCTGGTQNPCTSESKKQGNGDYTSFQEAERNNNNNHNHNNNNRSSGSSSSKSSNVNRRKAVSTKMSQAQIRYTFYNCPPYQCPYCKLTGATLDVIRNHLKCYHLKFDSTCNYCAEIFLTKSNLREHIPNCPKCTDPSAAVALLAGKKNKQQEKSTPGSGGSWICEFCGKNYASRVYMSKHIIRVHGDNVFPCPCCPKKFRTRTYLSRHMDCHVTSRQFVCETCGGTYKSAHHLRLHVRRTHNPEVREKLKVYHKQKDREYKIKRKAMQKSTVV